MMPYTYDLTLGLPHTNHRFLSEHLLLQHAGHFQWQAIAAVAGVPLSQLRSVTGDEVYASFYFIEALIPAGSPLEGFRLDDTLRFMIALRAYKNIVIEGQVFFDRLDRLANASELEGGLGAHNGPSDLPFLRFANIFITPSAGNSRLRVAPPATDAFTSLPVLPNEENPYHLTRAAAETMTLGLISSSWMHIGTYLHRYDIDIDRDTNGAGLVYFANYVAFMDTAERLALAATDTAGLDSGIARLRSIRHRRIAYYGNAELFDTLTIHVDLFRHPADPLKIGLRFSIQRQHDGQVICLSEVVKAVPARLPR